MYQASVVREMISGWLLYQWLSLWLTEGVVTYIASGENLIGRWVVRTVADRGYMTILVISKLGDSWGGTNKIRVVNEKLDAEETIL